MANGDNTPDVSTVLADPNFHALNPTEKNKVLLKIDPNYAGLPPAEQAKALEAIHYGSAAKTAESSKGGSSGSGGGALSEGLNLVKGAAQGFWKGTEPHAMLHQVDDPNSFLHQTLDPLAEQESLAESTHGVESLGHKVASYIPVIGPLAAGAGEKFGHGDVGGGLVDASAAVLGAHEAVKDRPTPKPRTGDVRNSVAESIVQPTIPRSARKMATEERYGHNPNRAIVRESVSTSEQASKRMDAVGQAIDQHLQSGIAQTVDIEPMVRAGADAAIAKARKAGELGAIPRIVAARDAMLTQYGNLKKAPRAAAQMYRDVREGVKFGPDPERNIVSEYKKSVASAISGDVQAKVPSVAPLMDRYGDLVSARDDMLAGERRRLNDSMLGRARKGAEVRVARKVGQVVGRQYGKLPAPPESAGPAATTGVTARGRGGRAGRLPPPPTPSLNP